MIERHSLQQEIRIALLQSEKLIIFFLHTTDTRNAPFHFSCSFPARFYQWSIGQSQFSCYFYRDSDQWISFSGFQNRVCSVMSFRHFAIIAPAIATLERKLFLRYFSISPRLKMPPKKKEEEKPTPLMGRFGTSLKCGIVGLPNVG